MSGKRQKETEKEKEREKKKNGQRDKEITSEKKGGRGGESPFLPICGNTRTHVETLHIYARDFSSRSLRD